ncbi:Gibberellin-regulated protein 3 [Zostera marina]|uniref:Gibberellin-regulated protein 3 n=1 Tax=Zostera marina TaxID=29655 RepID=A0A0K9NRH1_ZOSMR|nr:Gibberellin-regulated protein 3 [Zostera marina]
MSSCSWMRASMLLFLLLSLLLAAAASANMQGGGRSLVNIDCGAECDRRCELSSRKNLCLRACGTCCSRCNCVPPGTFGNKDVCPCYANMKTHGGRLKCP